MASETAAVAGWNGPSLASSREGYMRTTIQTLRSRRSGLAVVLVLCLVAAGMLMSVSASAGVATCDGVTATIVGTDGNNEIDGTPGRDVVQARGGNDEVDTLGGNDLICGGSGSDDLSGDGGDDRVLGNAGNDELDGNAGSDRLVGGRGFDTIDGGLGNDSCSGENVERC